MDKIIQLSHDTQKPVFCATEYECSELRKRAKDLGIDIPVPVHYRSVHQGTEVILIRPAEQLLEELLMIKVRGNV